MTTMNEEQIKKLINRIERGVTVNEETGCWEWNNYCNKVNGYGQFWIGLSEDKKNIWGNAHRVSYELFWGPVPEGLEVAHTCHNPKCCNPNHLVACTHKENIRMSVDAGRKLSKVTPAMIETIKDGAIFKALTKEAAARIFDISSSTIYSIMRGNYDHYVQ